MGVSIVVGGQLGSEGKGKVTQYFAKEKKAKIVVRVGGPNSGHTGYSLQHYTDGKTISPLIVLQVLPVGALDQDTICVLPAGSYIDLPLLLKEIQLTGITPDRLKIDPNAYFIRGDDRVSESMGGLRETIGSTCSGTGFAVIRRIIREVDMAIISNVLAKHIPNLVRYLCHTKEFMRSALVNGENIIIEGTQGYGLSVLHSDYYPYATSRDTTAAGFLSETGLSPRDVDDVIMVIRSYPIRVGGNSGPMFEEVSWDYVTHESGSDEQLIEHTSVTGRVRRVGLFDFDMVHKAICANNPNIIVLNHADYFDYSAHDKTELTSKIYSNILSIERHINAKINYVGTGRNTLVKIY